MDAFEDGEDAAETDEGMMLKLLRLCQPPAAVTSPSAEGCRAKDASDGDGEEVEREAASFTHASFSLSTYDGANLCRPGRKRGGGELK
eukprot:superscaffoldBa00000539_g5495